MQPLGIKSELQVFLAVTVCVLQVSWNTTASRGTANPGFSEELSLRAPSVSKRQLEFSGRYCQTLTSEWFSVLWRCGEPELAHRLLLGIV